MVTENEYARVKIHLENCTRFYSSFDYDQMTDRNQITCLILRIILKNHLIKKTCLKILLYILVLQDNIKGADGHLYKLFINYNVSHIILLNLTQFTV